MKCILLLSGGIDSTTLLAKLANDGYNVTCLIFDYGQTLSKEIEISQQNTLHWGANPIIIKAPLNWLPGQCSILGDGSLITQERTVEQIKDGGTPTSYVPFRNGIFLAYCIAYGEAAGVEQIFCGGNGLLSGNYWDDTKDFGDAMAIAGIVGTSPHYAPEIIYPFCNSHKHNIVKLGLSLGLDYKTTWSCYKNGDAHCGKCDSCIQRRQAMQFNNLSLGGRKREAISGQ